MNVAAKKSGVSTYRIAREVGVSQCAVSQVLNQTEGTSYSEGTRQKIFEKARDLGYYTALMRKAIKQPLKHLGLMMGDIQGLPYGSFEKMFEGVSKAAARHGFMLMSCELPGDLDNESDRQDMTRKILDYADSRILDGLLIDKSHVANTQMLELEKADVPFVYINGRMPKQYVTEDIAAADQKSFMGCIRHIKGGQLAANHLLEMGHRRIALISAFVDSLYSPHFILGPYHGCLETLKDAGWKVPPELLVTSGSLTDRRFIVESVDRLLGLPDPPTAIFAADDLAAVLILNHLRLRGLRVPEDMSVMGYGNVAAAFVSAPELTTINVPWSRMGEIGIEMLISLVNGEEVAEHFIILDPELIYGGTVAPCWKRKDI